MGARGWEQELPVGLPSIESGWTDGAQGAAHIRMEPAAILSHGPQKVPRA